MPFSGDPLEWAYAAPEETERRDTRGEGEITGTGRRVRKYGGSRRPPGIDPDLWASRLIFSDKEKRQAIAQYEAYLKGRKADLDKGEPADITRFPALPRERPPEDQRDGRSRPLLWAWNWRSREPRNWPRTRW